MKKFIKRAVATALAVTMAATPVLAATPSHADDITSVRGVGTVDITPLQVMIPTNLDFYLDPFLGAGGASQGGNTVYKMWNLADRAVTVDWNVAFYAPGDSPATFVANIPAGQRINSQNDTNNIAMGIVTPNNFLLPETVPARTVNLDSVNWRAGAIDATHGQITFDREAVNGNHARASHAATNADNVFATTATFLFTAANATNHSNTAMGAFKFLADMHAFGWDDDDVAVGVRAVVDIVPFTDSVQADYTVGNTAFACPATLEVNAPGQQTLNAALANRIATRVDLSVPAVTFGTAMPSGANITRTGDSVITIARSRDILETASFAFPVTTQAATGNWTIASVTGATTAQVTLQGGNEPTGITLLATAGLQDRTAPIVVTLESSNPAADDVVLTFNFSR